MQTKSTYATAGFTLVEILIVVVILGILAAMVIPQFTAAGDKAQENAVKMDLHRVRQQIEIYRVHHNDTPPTLATFAEEMTMATDKDGNVAAVGTDGYPLGPYLGHMPINSYTNTDDVADIDAAAGASAWAYDETDGTFIANSTEEHRDW